ncbi:MAG TPA: class I SAM-dependent methyltransferase [Thiopseudomonas sp.]|nr:class I SAM-dependent methyltransferase [Thiopseudomonas sp.]
MNEKLRVSSEVHFAQAADRFERSSMSKQLALLPNELFPLLTLDKNQHWLDFGAGTGALSVPLADQVGQVTALDTSAAMLAKLADKKVPNISILKHDIFCGLKQSYSGVISSMALHHVADIPELLRCLHQCLKKGGQLALVDLYSEDGSFHGDNAGKGVEHLGFDPQQLLELAAQAGFKALSYREIFWLKHRNGRDYPLFLLQGHA